MTKPGVPEGDAYLWWSQGARDEAQIRDEGMGSGRGSPRELRDVLEALARCHPDWDGFAVLTAVCRIYMPERLRRRWRK
jgi:hypothetical protein